MFKSANPVAVGGIWIACLILPLLVGYSLAAPDRAENILLVGGTVVMCGVPIWLRWHHTFLILTWNAAFVLVFLPGAPELVLAAAAGSLLVSICTQAINRKERPLFIGKVAWPLVFIVLVVLATARLTGGIGSRASGGEVWGGRRYLWVFGAVIGYFALTAKEIPWRHKKKLAGFFFLSGATLIISDLIYLAGPSFYFLYAFFTSDVAASLASSDESLFRMSGISFGSSSICYFMLSRYGPQGLCEIRRPWRGIFFLTMAVLSLLGGFRSTLLLLFIVLLFQFYYENLYRTKLFFILLGFGCLVMAGTAAFSDRLPLSIQRSLSFLPVRLDPAARQDARGTLDWRIEMWQVLIPEIPQYLLLGKGFAFSGTDYYLTQLAARRNLRTTYDETLISGNYHSGILTLLIPFGIFGVLAFTFFCIGSIRVLRANLRYSPPALRTTNAFILSYFCGRLVYYLFFYGQFDLDLIVFTGLVGLSISLNGGVLNSPARSVPEESPKFKKSHAELRPSGS